MPFDRSELDSLGTGDSWLTGIFIDLVLYKVDYLIVNFNVLQFVFNSRVECDRGTHTRFLVCSIEQFAQKYTDVHFMSTEFVALQLRSAQVEEKEKTDSCVYTSFIRIFFN